MGNSQRFFFDRVNPMFEMDGDSLRVVEPGEDFPEEEYPGNVQSWWEGYRNYEKGYSLMLGDHLTEVQRASMLHGFMTARMAELLGAEVPKHIQNHGDAKLRRLLREESEKIQRRRENPGPPHSAEDLCPYDEETKREAWIAGYKGDECDGGDVEIYRQGINAWNALHDRNSEQPVPTGG
jgi:ribosome modulation factor